MTELMSTLHLAYYILLFVRQVILAVRFSNKLMLLKQTRGNGYVIQCPVFFFCFFFLFLC